MSETQIQADAAWVAAGHRDQNPIVTLEFGVFVELARAAGVVLANEEVTP